MGDKKVGFLGGSFDPIHFGHIHLGVSLQEAHQLDMVIICPAACSPFKNSPPQEAKHRLKMVELAIEGISGWSVLDWEVKNGPPSYTIDTVRYLLKNNLLESPSALQLLIGEDQLPGLPKWKEVSELLELAPPLIGCRIGCRSLQADCSNNFLSSELQKGMTPTKILEISASEIRERLNKGLYCGHLVPVKVLDYIHHHRLY